MGGNILNSRFGGGPIGWWASALQWTGGVAIWSGSLKNEIIFQGDKHFWFSFSYRLFGAQSCLAVIWRVIKTINKKGKYIPVFAEILSVSFLPAAKPLVLDRPELLGWGDRKKSSLQEPINPSLQILFRVGSVALIPDFSLGWDPSLSNKLLVELNPVLIFFAMRRLTS